MAFRLFLSLLALAVCPPLHSATNCFDKLKPGETISVSLQGEFGYKVCELTNHLNKDFGKSPNDFYGTSAKVKAVDDENVTLELSIPFRGTGEQEQRLEATIIVGHDEIVFKGPPLPHQVFSFSVTLPDGKSVRTHEIQDLAYHPGLSLKRLKNVKFRTWTLAKESEF